MFPNPKTVIKVVSWLAILSFIASLIYLLVVNFTALQYSPEAIVKKFIVLIENPTQTITQAEKQTLKEITQPGFFSSWQIENNLKTLRRISQQKPIKYTPIQYSSSKTYATTELQFNNDLKNPESKKAKIYMEQYGNWYTTGSRWRIYQIDMPKEDNVVDAAKDKMEEAKKEAESVLDRIKNWFNQPNNRPQSGQN